MASRSGGGPFVALLIGLVVVLLAVVGYLAYVGRANAPKRIAVPLELPSTDSMPNPNPTPPPLPKPVG